MNYNSAKSNQTLSSLIDSRIGLKGFKDLFESTNIVTRTKTDEEPFVNIANLPILNEEIGLWMMKQRNETFKVPDSSKKMFTKDMSNIFKEFDIEKILPDPCMEFAVKNSIIVNRTLPRAFQGFSRIGMEEDKIAINYSKGIGDYVTSVVGKNKEVLWSRDVQKRHKKAKTFNKKLFSTIQLAFEIGTELPVEGLIKTLEENTIFKRKEIQDALDWADKKILLYTSEDKQYMKRF